MAVAAANTEGATVFRYFTVDSNAIHVHSLAGSDAIVSASGELSIDGAAVSVTPQQHELIRHYYDSVGLLRDQAVATGTAGAATGAQAIASVVSGLVSGNPDKIGPEVEARAAKVASAAAKLCVNLEEVRALQNKIARQVPQFLRYALIDEKAVADCGKGST